MGFRRCALIVCTLLLPAVAHANDFGVLRTAVPVEKSVWRLQGGGVISIANDGREAVIASISSGLAKGFDFEGKMSVSGDDNAIGGGVNYSVMKATPSRPVDVSIGGGMHLVNHDEQDVTTVDIDGIVSRAINPKVSVYGALTLAFANMEVPEGVDGSTTNVYLVPGIDYAYSDKMHFVAEIGIGFDMAKNYIAAEVHYSFGK